MAPPARPSRLGRFLLAAALLALAAAARPAALVGYTDQPGFLASATSATWPASHGLLVSEIITGGAGASDEFVEIYNASSAAADLAGLELVYVTASGSTVSRKQSWASLVVAGHGHVLLANGAGSWAPVADGLYTGGFAATGGSVVLRTLEGAIIDSLSWGDASSAYVEGVPGAAPIAGASLERSPGGDMGNSADTNDNAVDTFTQPFPVAHSLSSAPVPDITVEPTEEPTNGADPTEAPTASDTPLPTIAPTMTPQPTPAPTATPGATPTPTPAPIATSTPTPTPSPSATPLPTPSPISIADARSRPIGATVRVSGVVVASAGVILDGSTLAITDGTAALYVRVPPDLTGVIQPGAIVDVVGVLAAPYGNLELRSTAGGVQLLGWADPPPPWLVRLDLVGEATEGQLVRATVTVTGITAGSGSLTLTVVDEAGDGRVFFHAPLGARRDSFLVGDRLEVTGLVGDRLGLYRIWPRALDDVVVVEPAPTPTARPTPTPRPTATARRTATPRPTASARPTATARPTASAAPSAAPTVVIAEALRRQGQSVTVEGVVTTRPGLLDSGAERVTLQDASGAVLLRLPQGASFTVGQRLRASGVMGTYYGAPQLTVASHAPLEQGTAGAETVRSAPIAASLEWRLVTVSGTVETVRRDGESWRAELELANGSVPIVGIDRSGIPSTALEAGRSATITGVVKRAFPTASDQRLAIVPRTAADVRLAAVADAGGSGNPTLGSFAAGHTARPGATESGPAGLPSATRPAAATATIDGVTFVTLADLEHHVGTRVQVGGRVVSIGAAAFVVDDGTATAPVRLTAAAQSLRAALRSGDLVNVTGVVSLGAQGAVEIVVDDTAGVRRLSASTATLPNPTTGPSAAAGATPDDDARSVSGQNEKRLPAVAAAAVLGLAAALAAVLTVAGPDRRARLATAVRRLVGRRT